jgi:hypothetical protein
MIKLFRNIRKNLLNEGKTTKYFKYAIGEIVLVVIGILIALQINTWNEDRKTRQSEQLILNNLKSEMLANKEKLAFVLQSHQLGYNNGKLMLGLFNTDISNVPVARLDSLMYTIEEAQTFDASDGFLKSLIASGKIDDIQNATLKGLLTSFEGLVIDATQEVPSFQKMVHDRLWPAIDGKLNSSNRLRAQDEFKDFPAGAYTSDYTWFFENREMEDLISNISSWKSVIISDEQKLMDAINYTLLLIDNELKQ